MEKTDMLAIENELKAKGFKLICGIDEAGRGPLAGPVCAAAVILKADEYIEGVNDSKKLTEKKREALYDVIREKSLAYGICMVDCQTIDKINILQATMLAMQGAVKELAITPDFVIVDGNKCPELPMKSAPIVKGDAKSASIAAASILAKVTRDRYMRELAEKYPCYGFEAHKGYGTKAHYAAIEKYGICEEHRRTFLKKILGEQNVDKA